MFVEQTVKEIELALVGRLVLRPTCMFGLHLIVEDFSVPWCRVVYEALEKCVEKYELAEINPLLIAGETDGRIKDSKLGAVVDRACPENALGMYANRIKTEALGRKVRLTAARLSKSDKPGDELLAEAMSAFNGFVMEQEGRSAHLGDIQREVWKDLLAAKRGEFHNIKTGLHEIDKRVAIERNGTCVIAGRPSMGKSALALFLARHIAACGDRILIFSTEMNRKKWGRRFMAAESRINSNKLASGDATAMDLEKVKQAALETAKLPIWIDDVSDRQQDICHSIREHRQRHQTNIAVVDHLQECIPGREPQREIAELLSALRGVARENPKTTLIIVSQLNRLVETRTNKMPLMSDLRESGRIEEVADSVLLCYRPAYYEDKADPSLMTVGIAKNRDGSTGKIHFQWDYNNGQIVGVRDDKRDDNGR